MQHVMIDIETMGIGNEAAIIAIGATRFDPWDLRKIDDGFYIRVDLASSVNAGMKMDASTINWWLAEERAAARTSLLKDGATPLFEALDGFREWFGDDKPTWGNGATFDNVIMRNAFKLVGIECPWGFRNDRCYRTLVGTFPKLKIDDMPDGIGHNAYHDALWQTFMLQAVFAANIMSPEVVTS
jgi:hypothetical protein